jgi:hypothetical protein
LFRGKQFQSIAGGGLIAWKEKGIWCLFAFLDYGDVAKCMFSLKRYPLAAVDRLFAGKPEGLPSRPHISKAGSAAITAMNTPLAERVVSGSPQNAEILEGLFI